MNKIHVLTHEFRPKKGGAGVVCEQVAETLALCGAEVFVWAPEYVAEENTNSKTPHSSYTLQSIKGLKGTRNPACLRATWNWIIEHHHRFRKECLYIAEPGPLEVLLWWTLLGKPIFWNQLVLTLHGSELVRYIRNPVWKSCFRRLLQKTTRVHVLSRHNQRLLLQHFPFIRPRCVCGFGILLPGETLESHLGVLPAPKTHAAGTVRILCVGRIHPRKGQIPLLEAVSLLPEPVSSKIELVFAGQVVKGDYYRKLMKVIGGCSCQVAFLGGISDQELQDAYQESDIFALTSMPYQSSVEGLGLVYLEAAMHGLPAIGHEIGGVSDAIQHEKTGLLADWRDRSALAFNLERVITDQAFRRQLGANARNLVAQCHWEPVVRLMFDPETISLL